MVFRDRDHPADPYPGTVPGRSFVHLDAVGHPLTPDRRALAGWRVGAGDPGGADNSADNDADHGAGDAHSVAGGAGGGPGAAGGASGNTVGGGGGPGPDLDDWLAARDAAPMAARVPLLVYGSNRCPSKITWLRRTLGLCGPVVVLRAQTRDVAAVWAAGLRVRDNQRPATLSAAADVREWHALWLATPDQIEVLDHCEGRGERYRLARPDITVHTEDGAAVERPWCYLGLSPRRLPILVDGAPVRCADLPQDRARALTGEPATDDGLGAETVVGAPHPDGWPTALFAYGLLRPGRAGWAPIAAHLAGEPSAARVAGTVYDTGLGWPALLLDNQEDGRPAGRDDGIEAEATGTLIPLRDPTALLPALDGYEGPDYRRVRLVLHDGRVSWAYVWMGDRTDLRPIPLSGPEHRP